MRKHSLLANMSQLWALYILIALSACRPGVPNEYIQPGDMEDILYDYHIADGLADRSNNHYELTKREYRLAVFKKHGVTEAQFDSSLVYYTRHTEELHKIYENLADRLKEDAQSLGASEAEVNKYRTYSANGDTTNIWTGDRSVVLVPNPLYNSSSFDIVADTTFHKGDVLILNFSSNFIFQDGMRDGMVVMAVTFGNDSIASQAMHVSSTMNYNIQIVDDHHLGIKEIRGYFLLNKSYSANQSSTTLQLMSLSDIQLIRIHENKAAKDAKEKADSLNAVNGGQNPTASDGAAVPPQSGMPPGSNSGGSMPVRVNPGPPALDARPQ